MTVKCPKCGYINTNENASDNECLRCGLIFSKYKSDQSKPELKPSFQTRPAKQKKSGTLLTIILFSIVAAGVAGLIIFMPHKEAFRGYTISQAAEQQRAITVNSDYRYGSEKKIALVIGNSAYKSGPLRNPVNDADLMKQSLKKIGFEVSCGKNLSRKEMKNKIRAFGKKLPDCGTGLFYYAGHGMQVKGRNFLLPVNENIKNEEDVEYEGIDVSRVLGKMSAAGNRINIVILDACRNNPFARNSRSGERGLAYMNAPGGTFIAYATGPGSVASDGRGNNSIYTQKLAHYIQTPQLKIEDVFKKVRVSVRSATNKRQTPWESTSLVGDFYFCPNGESLPQLVEREEKTVNPPIEVASPQYPKPVAKPDIIDEDRAFKLFQAAKNSKQNMDFEKAKEQLTRALSFISENNSAYQDIKDELYFHMPLHKAQWLLEKRQNVTLEKTLIPMKDYIKDHPNRFEFIQAIDRMETSLAMSDNQVCTEIKVQARNTLIEAQMFFAEWGRTPTLEDLNKNRAFKRKYPLEVLTPGNDILSLKVTDSSNRCQQGGVYVISSPGLPTDGWQ